MVNQKNSGSSITEQVVHDLLAKLEKSDIYPKPILNKLRDIAAVGKFASATSILEALNTPEEKKDETN